MKIGFVILQKIVIIQKSNSDISYSLDTDAYNYEVDEFLDDDTQEQFIFYILSKTKNKLRLKEIVSSTLNSACCERLISDVTHVIYSKEDEESEEYKEALSLKKILVKDEDVYEFFDDPIKLTNFLKSNRKNSNEKTSSYKKSPILVNSTNFGGLKQLQTPEKFKHELSNENTPLSIKKITNSKNPNSKNPNSKNPNSKNPNSFQTIISPCKIVSPTTTSPKNNLEIIDVLFSKQKSPSHKVKEKYLENLENSKQNQFRRSDLNIFSQFYDNSQVEKNDLKKTESKEKNENENENENENDNENDDDEPNPIVIWENSNQENGKNIQTFSSNDSDVDLFKINGSGSKTFIEAYHKMKNKRF
ncbi:hypothetical protein M0811_08556 [Anaeramoeba ignava]|uniref:Uncharacterized protein n=1 Tax=Anaeramoeba ignava TaxID=1746090 RepID=A0A9Q0RC71_ANAIG|nr:hypothetical protein M0811_08556 [Anaeramoeba ignava]